MMNLSKKTKIIATIGPSSDNYETLLEMARKGMNVMRLNFSHGTYDEHLIKINLARRLRKENNILVSIMLDTKGPEIRCHYFKNGGVTIEKDSIVRIGMDDVMGDEKLFSVTYPGLFDDIKVNDTIKIDDGKLQLTVIDKDHKTKQIDSRFAYVFHTKILLKGDIWLIHLVAKLENQVHTH
jgi:pyruvate kinase